MIERNEAARDVRPARALVQQQARDGCASRLSIDIINIYRIYVPSIFSHGETPSTIYTDPMEYVYSSTLTDCRSRSISSSSLHTSYVRLRHFNVIFPHEPSIYEALMQINQKLFRD